MTRDATKALSMPCARRTHRNLRTFQKRHDTQPSSLATVLQIAPLLILVADCPQQGLLTRKPFVWKSYKAFRFRAKFILVERQPGDKKTQDQPLPDAS